MTDFSHLRNVRRSGVKASGPFAHLLGGTHLRAYETAAHDAAADRQAHHTAEDILAAAAQARGEDPPTMHAEPAGKPGSAEFLLQADQLRRGEAP